MIFVMDSIQNAQTATKVAQTLKQWLKAIAMEYMSVQAAENVQDISAQVKHFCHPETTNFSKECLLGSPAG
jgi:hypothetical protein